MKVTVIQSMVRSVKDGETRFGFKQQQVNAVLECHFMLKEFWRAESRKLLIPMLLILKRPLKQKLIYMTDRSHLNEAELMVHKFGFIHVAVHCICRLIVMYFILLVLYYE
jgi:hypothetical protein